MSAVRTIISAVFILLGVVLVAAWSLASVVVSVVEDGTAARAMTARALDSPALMNALEADVSDHVGVALRDQGISGAAPGLDGQLTDVMARVVGSTAFRTALLNQAEDAHDQFSEQLIDPTRPPAPLTIRVDVSEMVGSRVGDLGGPAAALPALQVKPIDVRILEADRFEQARDAYAPVQWAHTWGLWLGLGAFAAGFVVSHRKRWFVAKALFGIAGVALGIAGTVTLLGPEVVVRFLPGSEEGVWASLWRDVVGPQASSGLTERTLLVGVLALVGGLIAVGIGAAVGDRRR